VSVANAEIITAKRERGDPTQVGETDLALLVEQMRSGWSALLASYPEKYLNNVVKAFQKLGAVMVWQASESQIEEAVRQIRIDD
jgi:hypothetical protein